MDLSNKALDEYGDPIVGANVSLKNATTGVEIASTNTGADGSWSFTGQPVGTLVEAVVSSAGLQVRKLWGGLKAQMSHLSIVTRLEVATGATVVLPDDSLDGTELAPSSVTEAKLAAGAATDVKVGNRTVNQGLVSPANTGTLTQLLSWLAGGIKAITGKANWYDTPDTTLAAAKVHADAATPHSGHATSAALTAHSGATTGVHGVTGSVVGTGGAQTLTDKTLTTPDINGASLWNYVFQQANYNAAIGDWVLLDCNGASRSVTLPSATGNAGRMVAVKKYDASAFTVTVIGNIDTVSNFTLYNQGDVITVVSNGNTWFII